MAKIDHIMPVLRLGYLGSEFWEVTHPDGSDYYHRDNGLPAVVWPDGSESYYEHGLLHRLIGPADVFYNTIAETTERIEEWWVKGELYR